MREESRRAKKLSGKVLSFEQKGDFYYKRGLERMDRNDLPEALSNYRIAMERDPENEEIRLAAAEALTAMERYDESNRLLLDLIRLKEHSPECYFGMGCNFMGLNDLIHARDSLEHYAELEPEGEFIYDAFDMLDALDDVEYEEMERRGEAGLVELTVKERAYQAAEEGRRLLEKDEYSAAEEEFLRALKLEPGLLWARNNLTLVYYCRREYKRAIAEAKKALEQEPGNLQALCNLAMLYNTTRNKAAASETADKLVGCETEEPDDFNRMSLVLMDMGRYEDAYPIAKKLARAYPYDAQVLHRLGMCAYETGRFHEAIGCYDVLLKVDTRDTIARYYRGLCRAAEAGGGAGAISRRKFMVNYQVPFDEMLARINRLNQIVSLPDEQLRELWTNDEELSNLVRWGFTLPDPGIKKAILSLVATFADAKGEGILRDFVLMREQPDELKQEAFALLAKQGAEEPYVGYLDGMLVESRASVGRLPGGVSKPYREALAICINSMHGRRTDAVMGAAVMIWERYVHSFTKELPRLTRAQTSALAAAIEYAACVEAGEKTTRSEVCSKYGISALRLKNALEKLGNTK